MSITAAQLVAEIKVTGASEATTQIKAVGTTVTEAEKKAKGAQGTFGEFLKSQLVFSALSTAAGFLKDQITSVFQESMDAQAGMAQTVAVLKSTHDASGMTADAVADLATKYSHLTLFSDDTTQAAENMLLTFTNIGKNVFPLATKTVLDMSQALGQDTKSSAIQLGKALNDPITGITALQRVGVTFTDSQKNLIKSLVDSGNVAGAQKVILQELQREFGGSAEAAGKTFPGQLQILGQSMDDIKQKIGDALLPILQNLTSWVSTNVVPAFDRFSDWFKSTGAPALQRFATFVQQNATPILAGLGGVVLAVIVPAFVAWAAAMIANPVGLIITGIALAVGGLAAGFTALYQHNAGFKQFIDGVANGFKQAGTWIQTTFIPAMQQVGTWIQTYVWPILQQVGSFIASVFVPVWQQLTDLWQNQLMPLFQQLQPALQQLTPLFEILGAILGTIVLVSIATLIGLISGLAKGISYMIEGLAHAVSGIVQFFTGLVQIVGGFIQLIVDIIHGNWSGVVKDLAQIGQGIINEFMGIWNTVVGILQAAWGLISGLVGGFVQGFIGFFQNLYNEIVGHSIIPDLVNGIITWISQLPGRVLGFIANMVSSALSKLGSFLSQGISWAGNFVSGIFNALGQLAGKAASAVGTMATTVLGKLGDLARQALQAGANIVQQIASGILNSIGSALGNAMAAVGNFIQSHLPHSPAKQGPLKTLAEAGSNIPVEIARGIAAGVPAIRAQVNMMLTPVAQAPLGFAASPQVFQQSLATQPQIIVQPAPVYLDGQRLMNGLMPYMANAIRYGTGAKF